MGRSRGIHISTTRPRESEGKPSRERKTRYALSPDCGRSTARTSLASSPERPRPFPGRAVPTTWRAAPHRPSEVDPARRTLPYPGSDTRDATDTPDRWSSSERRPYAGDRSVRRVTRPHTAGLLDVTTESQVEAYQIDLSARGGGSFYRHSQPSQANFVGVGSSSSASSPRLRILFAASARPLRA